VNPLSEIQWQGTITQFTSPNNTIRINAGNTGRVELAKSTSVKLHTTTDGVVVTGTLNTHTIPGGSGTLALTSDIPTNVSELTNDAGYITSADTFSFSVTADDSTLRSVDAGQSIQFIGGTNVTTESDVNGNITINGPTQISELANDVGYVTAGELEGGYNWFLTADDSTVRAVQRDSTVGFQGGARITTETDANSNVIITGEVPAHVSSTPPANPEEGELWWESDSGQQYMYYDGYWVQSTNPGVTAFSFNYNDLSNTPSIPANVSDLANDLGFITAGEVDGAYNWFITADDSTVRAVARDSTVKFIGGTNISTQTDADGNVTINSDGTQLSISASAPASPSEGEMWWESDSGKLYVYYDSYWVESNNPNKIPSSDGFVSKQQLKEIAAASTDFNDFKARIANL